MNPHTTSGVFRSVPCTDVTRYTKILRSSESNTKEGEGQEGDIREASHGGENRLNAEPVVVRLSGVGFKYPLC